MFSLQGNEMNTIAITDYELQSPTLARVVVSYTGHMTREQVRAALLEQFDNQVSPVENSFHVIKAHNNGGAAVGFVRANKEVRVVEEKELRAGYRTMASNIMMDNKDRSLWEVRQGAGAKYLARHGQEDLSELVEAKVQRRQDVPGIRHIAMAQAVKGEFASFVSKTGDIDHGFVIAANKEKLQVVSMTHGLSEVVAMSMVTRLDRIGVPKAFHKEMVKANIGTEDKAEAKEYWTKLYSYDPDYLADVRQQVEDTTFM
jgi:hypothetical protein